MGHPYKDYYLKADAFIKCAPSEKTKAHYDLKQTLNKLDINFSNDL